MENLRGTREKMQETITILIPVTIIAHQAWLQSILIFLSLQDNKRKNSKKHPYKVKYQTSSSSCLPPWILSQPPYPPSNSLPSTPHLVNSSTISKLSPHHHPANSPDQPIFNRAISRTLSLKTLKTPAFSPAPQSPPHKSASTTSHQNPASGYAAALLDIAQCNNSLEAVHRDAGRLLKLLQNNQFRAVLVNPFVGEKEKRQLVKEMAKRGKFNGLLIRLLKMLIERNKVTLVNDVLMEFERIYDELSGTKVVLVSSTKKVEDAELFDIAHRVQKLSGAIKVKVRNWVDERSLSFAM